MASISTWSTTAASNNSASPDGAPEGMNSSGVNNTIRENMAQVRAWYEDTEFRDWGHTVTQASTTTFLVATDVTSIYTAGRRIRCADSSTLYGYVASSSFSSPNTTVTVTLDSGSLSGSLTAVALGPDPTNGTSRLISPHVNEAVAVTATATELNTLDGITSTTAELNILDGVTATAAELNILDGVTATTTELNYVDGVTSSIQTQLDGKQGTISEYTASGTTSSHATGSGEEIDFTHGLGTDDVVVDVLCKGDTNFQAAHGVYITPDGYGDFFGPHLTPPADIAPSLPASGVVTIAVFNGHATTQTMSYRVKIRKRSI